MKRPSPRDRAPHARTSASSRTPRRTRRASSAATRERRSSPRTCVAARLTLLYGAERRRQELRAAGGRRARASRDRRDERRAGASAPSTARAWRSRSAVAQRLSRSATVGAAIRAAIAESLGAGRRRLELDGARARRSTGCAASPTHGAHAAGHPRPVRGVLPLSPDGRGAGTFAARVPGDRQRRATCASTS